MKPDRLDDLLAAYAAQPLPKLSEPSASEVWREIERRQRPFAWLRMFALPDWRELLSEPRLAVAGLAFAVAVGVVPAAAFNRVENERQLARQSIHFDVFSVNAGPLGSVFAKPVAMVTSGRR